MTQTPPLATGTMVGAYRLERLIGAGGTGDVYRALDTKLKRPVAIKLLSEALNDITTYGCRSGSRVGFVYFVPGRWNRESSTGTFTCTDSTRTV